MWKRYVSDEAAAYAAEFIGTFILTLAVGLNTLAGSRIWLAVSVGSVLAALVYCFAGVSGAHFNPAVSIAAGLARRKPWREVGIYCAVQLLAGVLAGITYGVVLWDVFTLRPAKEYHFWEVGLVEMLYTCMLCYVVLQVDPSVPVFLDTDTHTYNVAHGNQHFGIAIGFVLVAALGGAGHISGGCFNPAVAIGIDFSSMLLGFRWWILYVFFELVGAAVAAYLFRLSDTFGPANNYRGVVAIRSRLLAEFLGTFFVVLTVGLCVVAGSSTTILSIAAAMVSMTFAVAHVSGGLLNPAATLAVFLRGGEITGPTAAKYIVTQFAGAVVAGVAYLIIEHGWTFPLEIGHDFAMPHAMAVEFLFSAMLCYVVLATTTSHVDRRPTQFFALAIGLIFLAAGEAIGTVSGGVINPALTLGVAVGGIAVKGHFWYILPYMFAQFVGALVAVGLFRLTRPSEYFAEVEPVKWVPAMRETVTVIESNSRIGPPVQTVPVIDGNWPAQPGETVAALDRSRVMQPGEGRPRQSIDRYV